MDSIDTWAERIAEAVAPDEIDLAPAMVEAFIAGGAARKDLFRRASASRPGAFGPGDLVIVLPFVLNGLAAAGAHLWTVLGSNAATNFLSCVSSLLSIRDRAKRDAEVRALDTDRYGPLKRVADTLSAELAKAGVPRDQRDLITYRTLRVLLDEPVGGAHFVRVLTSTSS